MELQRRIKSILLAGAIFVSNGMISGIVSRAEYGDVTEYILFC